MRPIPSKIYAEIESLPTKAAKIRLLDERGYARADIARFLDIRYQHVRNVLERDRENAESNTVEQSIEPGNVESIPLSIDRQGRLTLPAEFRTAMQVDASGKVTARVKDGELRVIAPRAAIARAQKIAAKYKKRGEKVVEEFLAERRAMWGEE